jgi:hypothetical protein
MSQFSGLLRQRVIGVLLMALGAFALAAPAAAGKWSLAILGLPLIVLSVAEAYSAFTSPRRTATSASRHLQPCRPNGIVIRCLSGTIKLRVFVESSG